MSQANMSIPSKRASVAAKYKQVQNLVADFVPIKKACELIGLNRSTYYKLKEQEEAPQTSDQARGMSNPGESKQDDKPSIAKTGVAS